MYLLIKLLQNKFRIFFIANFFNHKKNKICICFIVDFESFFYSCVNTKEVSNEDPQELFTIW